VGSAAAPTSWLHAFVDVPQTDQPAARSFWATATGWPAGQQWDGHPEFVSLEPPDGTPYVHVQTIGGSARVHLDLVGDPDADRERLVALGATAGQRMPAWQVMASPSGFPFCLCDEQGPHTRPGPRTWPGGHRSRVVQVCLDVPAPRYDEELAFWQAATGWAEEPVRRPEFARLVHRPGSPLQLLVQRLDADDPAASTRAHLDLGTDDLSAEVARLKAYGARYVAPGDGWVTLEDPVGLPFCVTVNRPD
jgi:hypothetical protein